MLGFRADLGTATTALVLVVPVVAGVAVGGLAAGLVAVASCFLIYDFVFIPPYYTLYVTRAEDWVAMAVYAVVMALVAQVVARANAARAESQQRAAEVQRLFGMSELLVREPSGERQLVNIVQAVKAAFNLQGAALLLSRDGALQVVASVGTPLSDQEARHLSASSAVPVSLWPPDQRTGQRRQRKGQSQRGETGLQALALTASGRPVGLLALRGARGARRERELLGAFANHLALALERAELGEEVLRARLLKEQDRLRRSLVGAVSHDLRTPLATIKVSASALLDAQSLGPGDVRELAELLDAQADRLDRLVSNLLDMTRIQSGALELRRQVVSVGELVDEALLVLGRAASAGTVRWYAPEDLPAVAVDPLLVRQVLANLIDNAVRYSPPSKAVLVSARCTEATMGEKKVELSVADQGPGVPPAERARVFEMFNQREAGGRGGLGLAIVKAFLEAHGERIWVSEGTAGRGARFTFTLPVARAEP
jgi:two-component system sensor histidine kinase KdpD